MLHKITKNGMKAQARREVIVKDGAAQEDAKAIPEFVPENIRGGRQQIILVSPTHPAPHLPEEEIIKVLGQSSHIATHISSWCLITDRHGDRFVQRKIFLLIHGIQDVLWMNVQYKLFRHLVLRTMSEVFRKIDHLG